MIHNPEMNWKNEQNEYAKEVQRRWKETDEEMCFKKCGEEWKKKYERRLYWGRNWRALSVS